MRILRLVALLKRVGMPMCVGLLKRVGLLKHVGLPKWVALLKRVGMPMCVALLGSQALGGDALDGGQAIVAAAA